MSWTVYVETVQRTPDGLSVNCVLSDGTQKLSRSFTFGSSVTFRDVKLSIQRYLDVLVNADVLEKLVQPGVLDLTPEKEPAPPDPLPAKIWNMALEKLARLQRLVDLQVIAADDKALANQRQLVVDTFDPTYL